MLDDYESGTEDYYPAPDNIDRITQDPPDYLFADFQLPFESLGSLHFDSSNSLDDLFQ